MWAQLRVELRAKAPGETPSRRVGFRAEACGWVDAASGAAFAGRSRVHRGGT